MAQGRGADAGLGVIGAAFYKFSIPAVFNAPALPLRPRSVTTRGLVGVWPWLRKI